METVWFCFLTFMLATYVVLGGCDLGVGMLHLFVARTDSERKQVLESIGPVWKGNEVWLVASGGTLFLAFPEALATSFSGFYLPLMMILWLIVLRALGIEFRHQIDDPLWKQFWDVAFAASSFLLVVFFGAAIGNVVRGVPLDDKGVFFEPLWTDFRVGERTGILDWYTILTAVTAVLALSRHGALWLNVRTHGAVRERVRRLTSGFGILVFLAAVATTLTSFLVHPNIVRELDTRPWGLAFPVLALGGLIGSSLLRRRGRPFLAVVASALFLYGLFACAAVGIYPYILPGRIAANGLTVADAAADAAGLRTALYWWIPGMVLVCGYFVFLYRGMLAGHFVVGEEESQ